MEVKQQSPMKILVLRVFRELGSKYSLKVNRSLVPRSLNTLRKSSLIKQKLKLERGFLMFARPRLYLQVIFMLCYKQGKLTTKVKVNFPFQVSYNLTDQWLGIAVLLFCFAALCWVLSNEELMLAGKLKMKLSSSWVELRNKKNFWILIYLL